MGRSRFNVYEEYYPYFLTMSIVDGILLFDDPELQEIIISSIEFIQLEFRVTVYGYVLMPNHLHMIVEGEALSDKIRKFKSYTARRILDKLEARKRTLILKRIRKARVTQKAESEYQLWQEGYHPKQIDSEKKMLSYLDYIHYNPVKAGFVKRPEHWKYSSAAQYSGRIGELPVTLYVG